MLHPDERPTGPTVPINSLAWQMAQFEVHYLRNMVAGMISYAQMAKRQRMHRNHIVHVFMQARVKYLEAMERALVDETFRVNLSTDPSKFDAFQAALEEQGGADHG